MKAILFLIGVALVTLFMIVISGLSIYQDLDGFEYPNLFRIGFNLFCVFILVKLWHGAIREGTKKYIKLKSESE